MRPTHVTPTPLEEAVQRAADAAAGERQEVEPRSSAERVGAPERELLDEAWLDAFAAEGTR